MGPSAHGTPGCIDHETRPLQVQNPGVPPVPQAPLDGKAHARGGRDLGRERAFASGRAVGAAARSLLPTGALAAFAEDFPRAVAVTRENRTVLFAVRLRRLAPRRPVRLNSEPVRRHMRHRIQ